jgi:hypothetical protein
MRPQGEGEQVVIHVLKMGGTQDAKGQNIIKHDANMLKAMFVDHNYWKAQ